MEAATYAQGPAGVAGAPSAGCSGFCGGGSVCLEPEPLPVGGMSTPAPACGCGGAGGVSGCGCGGAAQQAVSARSHHVPAPASANVAQDRGNETLTRRQAMDAIIAHSHASRRAPPRSRTVEPLPLEMRSETRHDEPGDRERAVTAGLSSPTFVPSAYDAVGRQSTGGGALASASGGGCPAMGGQQAGPGSRQTNRRATAPVAPELPYAAVPNNPSGHGDARQRRASPSAHLGGPRSVQQAQGLQQPQQQQPQQAPHSQRPPEVSAGAISASRRALPVVTGGPPETIATLTTLSEENVQLKKNVEFLRESKKGLERQVTEMRGAAGHLEKQVNRYKSLWEQERGASNRSGGSLEISSLGAQLEAVMLIKDDLFNEVLDLRQKLQASQEAQNSASSGQAACVICMDRLVEIVCLPCKHLALCSYCASEVNDCPICRASVSDKLHVYTP